MALGTDHSRRRDLRRRLKATRLSCPLFDTTGETLPPPHPLPPLSDQHPCIDSTSRLTRHSSRGGKPSASPSGFKPLLLSIGGPTFQPGSLPT